LADYRKDQSRLLTFWPTIPIEVAPISAYQVLNALRGIGSTNPVIRQGPVEKAGPLKTDQDFFIIDAPFPSLLTSADVANGLGDGDGPKSTGGGAVGEGKWQVEVLSKRIKAITGVLEVGIFSGLDGFQAQKLGVSGGQKPVAVYFGLQDGSVKVRTAKQT